MHAGQCSPPGCACADGSLWAGPWRLQDVASCTGLTLEANAYLHRALQGPQPTPVQMAASGLVPGQDGRELTTAMLAAADPESQKMMLGERLFPLVSQQQPDLAGKITGMLLEMDNSELLLLLESPEALESKIDEALAVLRQHGALAGDEEQRE